MLVLKRSLLCLLMLELAYKPKKKWDTQSKQFEKAQPNKLYKELVIAHPGNVNVTILQIAWYKQTNMLILSRNPTVIKRLYMSHFEDK